MKLRHLLVFTLIAALFTLGTSCNKPAEKKIYGKWQLTSTQYRDVDEPEWEEYIDEYGSNTVIGNFMDDGTCLMSYGTYEETVNWTYDANLKTIAFDGDVYQMESLSNKEMVWFLTTLAPGMVRVSSSSFQTYLYLSPYFSSI